jgi:hypothetical protein
MSKLTIIAAIPDGSKKVSVTKQPPTKMLKKTGLESVVEGYELVIMEISCVSCLTLL